MKKLLPVVFILFCLSVRAQDTTPNYTYQRENNKAFSIGLDIPTAVKSEFFVLGAGASAKLEYPLQESLNLSITGGYQFFRVRDAFRSTTGSNPMAAFIPIKVGAKIFLGDGLYFEAEGGISLETNYEKRKYAAVSLGPGLMIPIANRRTIDVSVRYEDWGSSRLKLLGIRAAYRIDWL